MDKTQIIEQLKADGFTDEEIQTYLTEADNAPKASLIMEGVLAKEPARIAEAFNEIMQHKLSKIVDEYKKALASGEIDELEEQLDAEPDTEFDAPIESEDEEENHSVND